LKRQTWEYLEASLPMTKMGVALNKHGAEGWELVFMWKDGPMFSAVFKRPTESRA
jgi:hypothetical protein